MSEEWRDRFIILTISKYIAIRAPVLSFLYLVPYYNTLKFNNHPSVEKKTPAKQIVAAPLQSEHMRLFRTSLCSGGCEHAGAAAADVQCSEELAAGWVSVYRSYYVELKCVCWSCKRTTYPRAYYADTLVWRSGVDRSTIGLKTKEYQKTFFLIKVLERQSRKNGKRMRKHNTFIDGGCNCLFLVSQWCFWLTMIQWCFSSHRMWVVHDFPSKC